MKLIINADDLGLSSKVNNAIGNAVSKSYITSATILANSEHWDEVIDIAQTGKISCGVHLNLSEGKSLTNSDLLREYGIINSDGEFKKNFNFTRDMNSNLLNALYLELKEQISFVQCKIGNISHLDGHHHCHTWLGIEDIVESLLSEFEIKSIRNIYSWPVINPIQWLRVNNKFKKTLHGKIKSKYFTSYENAINKISSFRVYHELMLKNEVVELMCHPGHDRYAKELDLIKSNQIGKKLNVNMEMINYLDL